MQGSEHDPFGTAELRRRVLAAWAASPARFREDANAEEDYALGGYRDRVVVELAQNAADAAARAGVPGRLRLTLRDGTLEAANTGAPLDAAGVEALSTLRASSKRDPGPDPAPGLPGSGWSAGSAWASPPPPRSATSPPSARSPARWPGRAGPPVTWSGRRPSWPPSSPHGPSTCPCCGCRSPRTAHRRTGSRPRSCCRCATRRPRRWSGGCWPRPGPALLLALPALATVDIEVDGSTRVLTAAHDGDGVTITVDGVAARWRTAAAAGQAAPELLADRPAEERLRPAWSVRWAVPVTGLTADRDGDGQTVQARTATFRPAAARRGQRGGARAHAHRRAAEPARAAAGLVPAQPGPAARGAGAADRLPGRPGRRGLRGPAGRPRAGHRPAGPGPRPGGQGRAGRAAGPAPS